MMCVTVSSVLLTSLLCCGAKRTSSSSSSSSSESMALPWRRAYSSAYPPRNESSNNEDSLQHRRRGSSRPRSVADDHRYWVYSSNVPLPSKGRFVVMSFNILGVQNATQHSQELYPHIPFHVLSWDRRKGRILLEIKLWSPDVVCLQEVDRFGELQDELGQHGYLGVFKGRTGEGSDGCAIFWRERRFSLVEEQSIEFKEWDLRNNVAQLCVLQLNSREQETPKQESGSNNQPRNFVVFCNVHVLFNPKRGDVKIGQVRVLLKRARALSKKWGGSPVVIAGDFNSTPQSPLYQFISTSKLDVSLYDRRMISGQLETSNPLDSIMPVAKLERDEPLGRGFDHFLRTIEMRRTYNSEELGRITSSDLQCEASIACGNTNIRMWYDHSESQASDVKSNDLRSLRQHYWSPDELKAATGNSNSFNVVHPFKLRSAYASIKGSVENRDVLGEPLVTTYHKRFMGTVDYIWYTEGLCPIRVLDVLPINVLERTGGLPSKKWGSDHLALACEFALLTSKETGTAEQLKGDMSNICEDADLTDLSDIE